MKTIIETNRLVLREINPEDKEDLFQLHSDFEVQKFTGEPVVESMDGIELAIQERLSHYKTHGFGRWAVVLKGSNDFIGWSGLCYLPEFDEVDIGYRFKREHWGKGYATESAEAVIDYGFRALDLDRIIGIAVPENKASIRVMEKIGLKYYKQAPYDEVIQNALWYKLSKSDMNK